MKSFPIPSAPAGPGGDKPKRSDDNTDDKGSVAYAKGGDVKAASYAAGGPVLGRARDFMKEPSPFRDDQDFPSGKRKTMPEDQEYEKKGKGEQGKDKSSVKTPMPRK
jgi:hypothetical protein